MDIIIRKLELRTALSLDEKTALRTTFNVVREFNAGQDLLNEGNKPAFVGALLSGMLCRYKPLADGLRQIVSFPLPGDIFDLHSFTVETMDHSVGALTRSTVATASHSAVEAMADAHPRLGMLMWRDAVVEGSVFREWVVNCGRRNAYTRIAHLFCETYVRSADIGLAKNGGCSLPLTQGDLGDATGLSLVHVNRVLQRLRAEALITFSNGRLTIHDWEGLARAGGFNAAYLHAHETIPGLRGFAFRPEVNGHHVSSAQAATGEAGDNVLR